MPRITPAAFRWLLGVLVCGVALAGATAPTEPPIPQFTDVTKAAGLAGFRYVSGTAAKDYIFEVTGSGAAFVDYDADGWLDVYLPNGGTLDALRGAAPFPAAALFRNNGDGTFSDQTAKAGVANERWGQGICAGDADNDGHTDMYVTNFGLNRLYRNRGNGTFADVATRAGVAIGGWSTGCAFGDYDRDGWLDLFVAGYVDLDLDKLPPPATGPTATTTPPAAPAEAPPTAKNALGAAYVPGAGGCFYRGRRVMCGPRGLKGARDFLFHNNGDGTFTDVSRRAGVDDAALSYGFGVAWLDYDGDSWLDLTVANDSMPSFLYRNRRDGTFADESLPSGIALNEDGHVQAGMGIAVGDYDGDRRLDIHRTNFADDTNVLYRNDGSGGFTDRTWAAGLGYASLPFLGWGTSFFDYDNDGWLDVLVANGHVYPGVDAERWGTTYAQRLLLFRNAAGRFTEVGGSAGTLAEHRTARGSAVGDYDNDGDLDILLSSVDAAPALLRNEGGSRSGHWLAVRLIGDREARTPRDAIGAVVVCRAGGRSLTGEVASGRGYNSQSDLRVHFGLGAARAIDGLDIRWPNSEKRTYEIAGVDRLVTIHQRTGVERSRPVDSSFSERPVPLPWREEHLFGRSKRRPFAAIPAHPRLRDTVLFLWSHLSFVVDQPSVVHRPPKEAL